MRWQNRGQFFGIAAQLIRRILVDHARSRKAAKRGGGGRQITLSHVDAEGPASDLPVDVVDLHEALERLMALDPDQGRLVELFGAPAEWSRSLQSLLWTHATVQVPPFTGTTRVALPVACTYDLEVAAAKYFQALEDGDVPLEFLFSGSVFDLGETGGLRVRRIPWDAEAEFRLPVRLWRETMDRHFPGSAWLRLRQDAYARLVAYKARHALPTWEHAIEALLDAAEGR